MSHLESIPRSAFRVSRSMRGFTLLELMVATILLTIVMTAVYTSFSSAIRAWKQGEANLTTFQDARTLIRTFERELQAAIPKADFLFAGSQNEIEFVTLTEPMNPQDTNAPRPLWVRYSLDGGTLSREERPVEGVIDNANPDRLELGPPYKVEVAHDIAGLELTYQWLNPTQFPLEAPPPQLPPIELEYNQKGDGQPQGVQIGLTMIDPHSESEKTTFTTTVIFRGPTTPYEAHHAS